MCYPRISNTVSDLHLLCTRPSGATPSAKRCSYHNTVSETNVICGAKTCAGLDSVCSYGFPAKVNHAIHRLMTSLQFDLERGQPASRASRLRHQLRQSPTNLNTLHVGATRASGFSATHIKLHTGSGRVLSEGSLQIRVDTFNPNAPPHVAIHFSPRLCPCHSSVSLRKQRPAMAPATRPPARRLADFLKTLDEQQGSCFYSEPFTEDHVPITMECCKQMGWSQMPREVGEEQGAEQEPLSILQERNVQEESSAPGH
ncbi:hypothetical protein BU23DRAFT_236934 [Bimuria novae-zelandiae CBS 107.79]|uniref:Uncharacterized protein n=1 Tax=Bimuria novae-zelandiae CBS 107.79 TaxID=1447943 RepID=A0A6A5UXJ3_9PLEO|nr:hypothetical protein BU23DRAFT_236934 [Bimuria novae-zelandiae CBS 107.79]